MSIYTENYKKFEKIGQMDFDSLDDFFQSVKNALDVQKEQSSLQAIIVLGYSGNGKTTWIKKFVESNPEYEIISYDDIVREDVTLDDEDDPYAKVEKIGKRIESYVAMGKNIIFDGSFLNLLTRSTLTQTLHQYGYFVHAVDLTDDILKILPYRILAYCSRDLGEPITPENFAVLSQRPAFRKRYQHIMDYFAREKATSYFEEQKKSGVVYLDIDGVISKDSVLKKNLTESNNIGG